MVNVEFIKLSEKFNNKEEFEGFLSEVLKKKELSPEEKGFIIGKIVNTVRNNPTWFTSLVGFLSVYKESTEIPLQAIIGLVLAGVVSSDDAYYIVSNTVFTPLCNYGGPLSWGMKKAIENSMLVFYKHTSMRERLTVYGRLWNEVVENETVMYAITDYLNLKPGRQKRELLIGILKMRFNEKAVELLDKSLYLDFLSDATVTSFTGIEIFFSNSYWLYSKLLSLVSVLSKKEFEDFCKLVKIKFSSLDPSEVSNADWVRFFMFAFGINDVKIGALSVKVTEPFGDLVKHMAPIIPYLSEEKFWKLVHYIETFVDDNLAYLICLLNNDCIHKDRRLMLTALKIYLDLCDEDVKLMNHKLLIDTETARQLSLQQLGTLAARSVMDDIPVRFRFTPEAFEFMKPKLLAAMLADEDYFFKKRISMFILKGEVVQNG